MQPGYPQTGMTERRREREGENIPHSLVLVELVEFPSSAADAAPPVRPRFKRPLLLVVDVEVEPAF